MKMIRLPIQLPLGQNAISLNRLEQLLAHAKQKGR